MRLDQVDWCLKSVIEKSADKIAAHGKKQACC